MKLDQTYRAFSWPSPTEQTCSQSNNERGAAGCDQSTGLAGGTSEDGEYSAHSDAPALTGNDTRDEFILHAYEAHTDRLEVITKSVHQMFRVEAITQTVYKCVSILAAVTFGVIGMVIIN